MKQQDIAIIIIIVAIAGVASYFLVGSFITPDTDKRSAKTVGAISSSFAVPEDRKNFNDNSINPTVRIQVDENENENPFKKDD